MSGQRRDEFGNPPHWAECDSCGRRSLCLYLYAELTVLTPAPVTTWEPELQLCADQESCDRAQRRWWFRLRQWWEFGRHVSYMRPGSPVPPVPPPLPPRQDGPVPPLPWRAEQ